MTEGAPSTLSAALFGQTHALHAKAERSGIVSDILTRRVSAKGYALFLRNLAPAYRRLEIGLERHRRTPGVGTFARQELYRSAALETDLVALSGTGWQEALPPPTDASERYARRIDEAAASGGAGLIGHAYVRYLGDLSGGQIMKRLLAESLGLAKETLSFYEFPEIDDLTAYKRSFREALDEAPLGASEREAAIAAAIEAFTINIEVSDAVQLAILGPEVGPA
jgi:heme oxygenase